MEQEKSFEDKQNPKRPDVEKLREHYEPIKLRSIDAGVICELLDYLEFMEKVEIAIRATNKVVIDDEDITTA